MHSVIRGAAAIAIGLGLGVAGGGVAHADDSADTATPASPAPPAASSPAAESPSPHRVSRNGPAARPTLKRQAGLKRRGAEAARTVPLTAVAAPAPAAAVTPRVAARGSGAARRPFGNRLPTASPVQYASSTPAVATGTIGAVDPDGDRIEYAIAKAPARGSVVVDKLGTYTYTAGADLAGTGGSDSFTVTLRDSGLRLLFRRRASVLVPVAVTVPGPPPVPPSLSIADLAVTEGNGEHAHFMFVATLDKAPTGPVSVGYATADGTARAGVDYTGASGTLTFAPGVTTQTVHVGVIGDTAAEPGETFTVTLSNPVGVVITRAVALGTILNDDAPPTPTPTPTPTPGLSISDASAVEPGSGGMAPGFLHTAGNQILDSQNKTVAISGVNWFGMESTTQAPHGLWTRGYKDMINQMSGLGFNTIRLPYSSELLHTTAAPNGIDFAKNPDLQGLSGLQVMDAIIAYAGQQGMRVILDHHRSGAGAGTSENGLWYDTTYTEDAWVADWATLAGRYKNNPTVIGVDLHNEPHNGTWGGGGATDWARAAERAGNAALAVNPNLLIFVEGVETYQGQNYWWGGNLMGVKDRPIVLSVPNRVVYSPHDYPNSVFPQSWFQTADFGAGLPAVFRKAWGYIYENNIAPVYIGEFGTKLTDPKDAVWFEAITSYISGDLDNNGTTDIPAANQDISWTFWSWNPNSGDTGGILADDWTTVNQTKMTYLAPIQYSAGNGTSQASFTVTLNAPATQTVSVGYATANGTATAGGDYTATTGTLTFAPGETRKIVSVAVNGDALTEGSEDFHVVLSNPSGATLTDAMAMGVIADRATATTPPTGTTGGGGTVPAPADSGPYTDIMTFGMFHGSSHTGMDALAGGRTAITTEALVAYNDLRRFAGLAPAKLEDVGRWAFANQLTNNAQAWDSELQGVGLYYAMQGAKVGWIAADKYTPQIVADAERTARLGSAEDVMAMVRRYGHTGFADYLTTSGNQTAFVDTLKMEPHYGGWMHDRANGRLLIEGSATAHDVNHLTVLSHDQMQPFMNDTWDWPQWPALDVSRQRVIAYYQSMVTLGDPRGTVRV
ncbi:MAG: cellulase family glycosylhydrolase [Mycobacterium sp.]